jgi:hypothetical protein
MKKYIISILIVSIFLINLSFITPKALASDTSVRDFINLLISIGVITPAKMPALNAYLATLGSDTSTSTQTTPASTETSVPTTAPISTSVSAYESYVNYNPAYKLFNSYVVDNSSDEPFVSVLQPNGGEWYTKGGMIFGVFGTNFPKDTPINIFFIGQNSEIHTSATMVKSTNNKQNFGFMIPNDIPPGEYKLRVARSNIKSDGSSSACYTNCIQDISDGYFQIISEESKPKMTLSYPNGGEIFKEGDNISIKWDSQAISNLQTITISLQMLHLNGSIGKEISRNVPNTGTYNWLVKPIQPFYESEVGSMVYPNGQYKVGIMCHRTDLNCNFTPNNDQSDDYFTIN